MSPIHGFALVRETPLLEADGVAALYRHVATGAELLSIRNADRNKCFGVAFRTLPTDSTGVAHILEHGVLAGSRKYPLKDPFAELLKSSLQTFLNAITYGDKTVYPVASQNLADFHNLVDVYLDTVFHPLLRRQTFLQQGWHYELDAPDAPLVYKGVVFNEMKGAFSSPDTVLLTRTRQALFPDTTYRVVSGGEPHAILDLSYEQWVAFHQTHYQPSNARFWFYGDDPADERLRLLDGYLQAFAVAPPVPNVALQPRWDAPRHLEERYAASASDAKQAMLTVNWLLHDTTDAETTLALTILAMALTGLPASPLRRALTESGRGSALAGAGYADGLRESYFGVGLKGIAATDGPQVEQLIITTLGTIAEQGFDPATVTAAVNTVEFGLRENNQGGPQGLNLFLRALGTWLYDGDPLARLQWEVPLARLKARLAGGEQLLEALLERWFVANPHRLTLLLRPDAELAATQATAEQSRLAAARAALSDSEVTEIIATTAELRRIQATPDAPEVRALIPTLARHELEPTQALTPQSVAQQRDATVLHHPLATNGLVYLDLGFDLRRLDAALLPYAAIWGRLLTELGTTHDDYVALAQRIGSATGGIRAQVWAAARPDEPQGAVRLFVRGKSTVTQGTALVALLRDIMLSTQFDQRERVGQLVAQQVARLEAQLVPSGHIFVNQRIRAQFNGADWANEQLSGISQLLFLRQLAEQIKHDWSGVRSTLEALSAQLVVRDGLVVNLAVDAEADADMTSELDGLLAALPTGTAAAPWALPSAAPAEGLIIPANVNYVGKGANLYALGYKLHGSILAATRLLGTSWLWEQVRVQGGAYGGFCAFSRESGAFNFASYRDPNLLATLEIFDRTGGWLRALALDENELTRSIIGATGLLDAYELPDAKSFNATTRWLTGETAAQRQQLRDELLATTPADMHAFADVLDALRDHGTVVVMGGAPALAAANHAQPGLLTLTSVL